jgi:hypothetical protein
LTGQDALARLAGTRFAADHMLPELTLAVDAAPGKDQPRLTEDRRGTWVGEVNGEESDRRWDFVMVCNAPVVVLVSRAAAAAAPATA